MSRQLVIPAPLAHQRPVLSHESRRKIWRAGRRTGKTRAALIAATVGHGPVVHGKRLLRGILGGASGVWIAPDYPQSRAIWREELEPRFTGCPGIEIAQSERRISVQGLGRLEMRSAENIDAVRGSGLDFAIIDEGAHMFLKYALNAVILPALLDRNGWLLIISSPNAGHDGNPEHETPSYFNQLCEEVMDGAREHWAHFHNRTEDNPTITPEKIAELRAEYPPNSPTARQELDAELGVGAGRFYPELSQWERLLVKEPPRLTDWLDYWGSYDWGYVHPACFCQFVRHGDTVYLLDTLYMHRFHDEEMGAAIRGFADPRCIRLVYAGHDAFAKRLAHSAAAETVADVFARYEIALEKAAIDRLAGAKVLRRLFREPTLGPDPKGSITFRVVDTPGNRRLMAECASLIADPLNVNVPAKRDANERGENGDDGADALRYGLTTPSFEPVEPLPPWNPQQEATSTAMAAPWEAEAKRWAMPDADGRLDRREYTQRGGLTPEDTQFGG